MNFINIYLEHDEQKTINNLSYRWINIDKLDIAAFYNINSSFLTNTLIVNYNATGNQTITLSNGLYESLDDIATELQTQLQTVDAGFTSTVGANSKKITIAHTTNSFTLDFSSSNLYLLLGFLQSSYSANTTFTGDYIMNLRPYAFVLANISGIDFPKKDYFNGSYYHLCVPITNKFYSQPSTDYLSFDNSKLEYESVGFKKIKEQKFNKIKLNLFLALTNDVIYNLDNDKKNYLRIAYY